MSRRAILAGGLAAAVPLLVPGVAGAAVRGPRRTGTPGVGAGHVVRRPGGPRSAVRPAADIDGTDSTFFATAYVPYTESVDTSSNGDLWPSCWADDGELYAANGDGTGFSSQAAEADVTVNRISGTPETGLSGTWLASGAQVAPIWSDPSLYNRKPTGMVAVDGNGDGKDELYLVVQDLRYSPSAAAFNDAPAASVTMSTDYGATWQPTSAPMFTNHVFTTVFFLDFGQSNSGAAVLGAADAGYVYAYGLDGNWRTSYNQSVPNPVDLYLARVPIGAIQDIGSWQFFTGTDQSGDPQWSTDISARVAVLHDDRVLYPSLASNAEGPTDLTVLSQGGVVYNAPLGRYIYTSWSEYTFEFYEAPRPWGPWQLFLHRDFGPYPWFGHSTSGPGPKNGGYATTAPSKFISADGLSLWIQSNWFVDVGSGSTDYDFSLRQLKLTPYHATTASNPPDSSANLAATVSGATPIAKTFHYGHDGYLGDGNTTVGDDSWDGTAKTQDWWGWEWPEQLNFDRLVYTSGAMFSDGGWFANSAGGLQVQVRNDFVWTNVTNLTVDPSYPYDSSAGPYLTYTLTFDACAGDGIRIIGAPGGTSSFTSVAELAVYYNG